MGWYVIVGYAGTVVGTVIGFLLATTLSANKDEKGVCRRVEHYDGYPDNEDMYRCSVCGYGSFDWDNYCPHCGRRVIK